jgi:DNA-binding NtrC family response regulator
VIPLADSLSRRLSCRIGRAPVAFTAPALKLLQQQPWPGNVTQLAAVVEKLVAFSPDGLITKRLVSSILAESPASVASLRRDAVRRQRDELLAMLDSTGGNLAEAARRMEMSRGAVIYRAQKFGLLARRLRGRG